MHCAHNHPNKELQQQEDQRQRQKQRQEQQQAQHQQQQHQQQQQQPQQQQKQQQLQQQHQQLKEQHQQLQNQHQQLQIQHQQLQIQHQQLQIQHQQLQEEHRKLPRPPQITAIDELEGFIESSTASSDSLRRINAINELIKNFRDEDIEKKSSQQCEVLRNQFRSRTLNESDLMMTTINSTLIIRNGDHLDTSTRLNEIFIEQSSSRGRPKGSILTACGLPRSSVAKKYADKSPFQKIKALLSWIISDDEMEMVIDGEHIVQEMELLTPIPDSLLDESVDIKIVSQYLTENALKAIATEINRKKIEASYTCGTCHNVLKEPSILCESCLLWHDFVCVRIKRAPLQETWFCPKCCY